MPRKQGVRCRNCLSVLRVRSKPKALFVVMPLLVPVVSIVALKALSEVAAIALIVVLFSFFTGILVIASRYPMYFCRLELPTAGKNIKDDDELWKVAEEEDDDEVSYSAEEVAQWEHDVEQRNGVPWICLRCNETNPVEFFFCWSCGAPSKAVE